MKNLEYDKLEMQEYLKLDAHLAKTVFKYRVRMAPFSKNFKGQGPLLPCPLCGLHFDTQSMSFQCSKVREKVKISENYENIFKATITKNLAKTIMEITKLKQDQEKTIENN